MDLPFIHTRQSLADASSLIETFGVHAEGEAASRAAASRAAMNVNRYCHWRQVERLVASLADERVIGSIH